MIIITTLQMGVEQILTHKLRSFLTMLGIILGVASLISLFAIVEGGKQKTLEWMKEVGGLEKVAIVNQELNVVDRLKINRSKGRTYDDSVSLGEKCNLITYISPEVSKWYLLEYKKNKYRVSVYGVTDAFLKINKYEVARGRYITDWDLKRNARVCVIGDKVAGELLKNDDPLGKHVYINGQYFLIVGILKRYEMWMGKRNALDHKNNWVSIPLTTMQKRFTGDEVLTWLNVSIEKTDKIDEAIQQIKNILLKRHFYLEDFKFDTKEEMVERIKQTTKMWSIVLGGIGAICLLVGGIGIMNIMLASVTERTREIGIRRAIGAKKKDVLFQFLLESTIISVLGGLLGILAGILFIKIISLLPDQTPKVALEAILLSFSFSVAVGLFFGVYPATKAANLNPIEALRYE